jgi:3-oxoacyl-[acyl-carrier protein] reductase
MKKILIFGINGRVGREVGAYLARNYEVVGVDTADVCEIKTVHKYYKYCNLSDLNDIYRNDEYYSVIHMQQIKSKNFLSSNLLNLEYEDLISVMDINLYLSLFSSKKYIEKVLQRADGSLGRIINFGSTYGVISSNPELYENNEMGNPIQYTLSKFGINGLTKYLASYFKLYKTLVNNIVPHGIENNQSQEFSSRYSKRNPIGRLSNPSELFPIVECLLDEKNTYMNGATLMVDGGWTAC